VTCRRTILCWRLILFQHPQTGLLVLRRQLVNLPGFLCRPNFSPEGRFVNKPVAAIGTLLLALTTLIFALATRTGFHSGTDKQPVTATAVNSAASPIGVAAGPNATVVLTTKIRNDRPSISPDDPRVAGMVWVHGGEFQMGSSDGTADEAPRHRVALDGFWMDAHEITNQQFARFVEATGYVTTAELPPQLRSIEKGAELEHAAILEEFNHPGSICSLSLRSRDEIDPARGAYSWWQYVKGASWKYPEGPTSDITNRAQHPVVHVSWLDAQAYCRWAGKQLPSEAQWEYAARAGRTGQTYPWGNERNPEGRWLHNIWQGEFPVTNTATDGYHSTAPVKSFAANDFGLYEMSGNVWEWCEDYYQPDYYQKSPLRNPVGPDSSYDPQEPGIIKRVQRGGSFMCSEQYCAGYRVSARMKGEQDTGAFHTGFRCILPDPGLSDTATP
jgi:sulfatase modifying factor 1